MIFSEVRTDGRTVWVDLIITIARFCPVSGEVNGEPPEMRLRPRTFLPILRQDRSA